MVYFFFQTKNLNINVYLKEKMYIEEMVAVIMDWKKWRKFKSKCFVH